MGWATKALHNRYFKTPPSRQKGTAGQRRQRREETRLENERRVQELDDHYHKAMEPVGRILKD